MSRERTQRRQAVPRQYVVCSPWVPVVGGLGGRAFATRADASPRQRNEWVQASAGQGFAVCSLVTGRHHGTSAARPAAGAPVRASARCAKDFACVVPVVPCFRPVLLHAPVSSTPGRSVIVRQRPGGSKNGRECPRARRRLAGDFARFTRGRTASASCVPQVLSAGRGGALPQGMQGTFPFRFNRSRVTIPLRSACPRSPQDRGPARRLMSTGSPTPKARLVFEVEFVVNHSVVAGRYGANRPAVSCPARAFFVLPPWRFARAESALGDLARTENRTWDSGHGVSRYRALSEGECSASVWKQVRVPGPLVATPVSRVVRGWKALRVFALAGEQFDAQ